MREYEVKLYDEDGSLILSMKANAKKKRQTSGRIGIGPVKEKFIMKDFKIRIGKKYGGGMIENTI